MKNITIKTDKDCGFLRFEAMQKAIWYEENLMKDRKAGVYNSAVFVKTATKDEFQFIVYHTKTSIIIHVRLKHVTT